MTAFWSSFFQEPDSIRTAGRRAHIRDVIAPVGTERAVVPMTDMAALAAMYPPVAAALNRAGLTGRQHDAYRLALLTVLIVRGFEQQVGPIEPTSVLAKNLAFVAAHPDELEALASAGIKGPGALVAIGAPSSTPQTVEKMGPLGIWRTP
jgi:hypothetical protein